MHFHIITFGCQMNVNDSDWLARILRAQGHQESAPADADIVIINTCSVREKPELKVRSTIGRIYQETSGKSSVLVCVAGCVAQQLGQELFSFSPQVRLVAGGDATARIPAALALLSLDQKKKLCLTDFSKTYQERQAVTDKADPTGYVNIMQGCDNFCTYCIVPFTRGRQKSRSSQAILDECHDLLQRGAREIMLLGQNVNAYGLDKSGDGTSFASLVHQVAQIEGLERLRYVTPHPKDMGEADIAAFAELKTLCPRLHLPMQSGSDTVLKRMHRRYDSATFLDLVHKLKQARPDLTLSTDIIVGFPGETEEDFLDTLALMRECQFVSSFSFCYSDRPGTRASGYTDKIAPEVQLDRLQRLQALQDELTAAYLATRLHSSCRILCEQPSPRQDQDPAQTSWQGRDPYGFPVHVTLPSNHDYKGAFFPVTITGTLKHSLQGKIIAADEEDK